MINAEAVGLLMCALIAVVVGLVVLDAVTGPEMHAYVDAAQTWCAARDGELYNSQSVVHGGLHCELPNGTSVHMARVVG